MEKMMQIYNSFNEMLLGTGAVFPELLVNNMYVGDGLSVFTDNMMSPRAKRVSTATKIPFCFGGRGEKQHGNMIEPPHIHYQREGFDLKFWLNKAGKGTVTLADNTAKLAKRSNQIYELTQKLKAELKSNWQAAAMDWNDYIDRYYPEFADNEKVKIKLD